MMTGAGLTENEFSHCRDCIQEPNLIHLDVKLKRTPLNQTERLREWNVKNEIIITCDKQRKIKGKCREF